MEIVVCELYNTTDLKKNYYLLLIKYIFTFKLNKNH